MANNKEIFEKLKGEKFMCQALRELMADGIEDELMRAEIKGEMRGEARGASRERTALLEVMQRLRSGESEESIRMAGYDAETLDTAIAALKV